MNRDAFTWAWENSGLQLYFDRMDDLKRIGFRFDKYGDMDFCESEALKQWLDTLRETPDDHKGIMDVTLEQIEAAKDEIMSKANVLRDKGLY